MKIYCTYKNNGVTLIELIIAIAILAIAFTGISSVFINAMNSTKLESSRLDTTSDVQSILQTLRSDGNYGVNDIYNYKGVKNDTLTFYYNNIASVCGDKDDSTTGLLNLPEPSDPGYMTAIDTIFITPTDKSTDYKAVINIEPAGYEVGAGALTSNSTYITYRVAVTVFNKVVTPGGITFGDSSIGYAYIGG
jgi:prepilin-type N-terminal cleavage/methylation domain-containing protein